MLLNQAVLLMSSTDLTHEPQDQSLIDVFETIFKRVTLLQHHCLASSATSNNHATSHTSKQDSIQKNDRLGCLEDIIHELLKSTSTNTKRTRTQGASFFFLKRKHFQSEEEPAGKRGAARNRKRRRKRMEEEGEEENEGGVLYKEATSMDTATTTVRCRETGDDDYDDEEEKTEHSESITQLILHAIRCYVVSRMYRLEQREQIQLHHEGPNNDDGDASPFVGSPRGHYIISLVRQCILMLQQTEGESNTEDERRRPQRSNYGEEPHALCSVPFALTKAFVLPPLPHPVFALPLHTLGRRHLTPPKPNAPRIETKEKERETEQDDEEDEAQPAISAPYDSVYGIAEYCYLLAAAHLLYGGGDESIASALPYLDECLHICPSYSPALLCKGTRYM